MTDDDSTPRYKRPGSHWDDDKRVSVGRDRRNAPARGVPISQFEDLEEALPLQPPPDEDTTKPREILSAAELEIWKRIDRHANEQKGRERSHRDTADRILAAIGDGTLVTRLARLETRIRILWGVLALIGATAIGEAITIGKGLYAKGETDGMHEQRLLQVEHQSQHNADRIDRFERVFIPAEQVRHFLSPPKDSP